MTGNRLFKIVAISFITIIIRSMLQLIIPSTNQSVLQQSVFVKNGTLPIAFMIYGTIAYTAITIIFILYQGSGKVMEISMKRATKEDAQILSNIYALSWKSAYKGIVPQRYLDELKSDFWVTAFQNWITSKMVTAELLWVDNFPVGGIAYGSSRDESLSDWGEIVSIYVHPDHYRKGYGKMLLDIALKVMRKDGYKSCYLWVLEKNENAKYFYEKNGFKCNQDQFQFEIMGKQLTDLRYVLDLNN